MEGIKEVALKDELGLNRSEAMFEKETVLGKDIEMKKHKRTVWKNIQP